MTKQDSKGAGEGQKLSVRVVRDLLREIADGTLREGDSLPSEPELIERFQVSRITIREAIQTLAAKGFVAVRHGRVASVAPRYYWNGLDPVYLDVTNGTEGLLEVLVEARMLIEPTIAGLAAARMLKPQVEELRSAFAGMQAVEADDPSEHAENDLHFHALLAEGSQNRVLVAMHATITQLGRTQRERMAHDVDSVTRANFWHSQILEAVVRQDSSAAEAAMQLHLRQVMDDLAKLGGKEDS